MTSGDREMGKQAKQKSGSSSHVTIGEASDGEEKVGKNPLFTIPSKKIMLKMCH